MIDVNEPFWQGLAARLVSAIEAYVEAYQRDITTNYDRERRLQSMERRRREDAGEEVPAGPIR